MPDNNPPLVHHGLVSFIHHDVVLNKIKWDGNPYFYVQMFAADDEDLDELGGVIRKTQEYRAGAPGRAPRFVPDGFTPPEEPSVISERLVIDSGSRDRCLLTGSILPHLSGIRELRLLSGWWLWADFSKPPAETPHLHGLKECYMQCFGSITDRSGLGRHRNVFAHADLETLTIKNHDDRVGYIHRNNPLEKIDGTPYTTGLKKLSISGLDVRTMVPALHMPAALLELTFLYTNTVSAPRSVEEKELLQRRTDEILTGAFASMFGSLEKLIFRHVGLGSYPWGRFEKLCLLYVHYEHLFPSDGVWEGLELGDVIPPALETLFIGGCKFGSSSSSSIEEGKGEDEGEEEEEKDVLTASLLKLADEIKIQREMGGGHELRFIRIIVARDSPQPSVPEEIWERFRDVGILLKCGTESGQTADGIVRADEEHSRKKAEERRGGEARGRIDWSPRVNYRKFTSSYL
ncbi:hypothetical protein QBC46DRAFT_341932 [Diplogelasinospora grovesii]|uniref:C2H2-type domain-containing protein n=1 Tax=Diplogelasinospora grovesii TaxID=303347 RepID=A0AAN6N7X1_9PEZI|nr:hypothetical protein QBC46DRAFT_341932 [Diplogelasinospora grovesii]